MSNELTVFLNFTFQNSQVTTKVVDDYSGRISTASRWQLNWAEYSKCLADNGVCTDPDLRPSLRRYSAPQPDENLFNDLRSFQQEMRSTALAVARTRSVPPDLWKRVLREAEGHSSVLAPSACFEGEITPENIGRLKLNYTYDTPVYRACIMSIFRDLVSNGEIFRLRADERGVFSLPDRDSEPPQAPSAAPGLKKEAIPLKEALSRAARKGAPASPRPKPEPETEPESGPPVVFTLMSDLSDDDIILALSASSSEDDEPLPLTEPVPMGGSPSVRPPEPGVTAARNGPEGYGEPERAAGLGGREAPLALTEQLREGEEPVTLTEQLRDGEEPVTLTEQLRDGDEPVTLAEPLRDGEEPVTLTEQLRDGEEPAGLPDADNSGDAEDPAPGAGESFRAEEPAIYAEKAASAEEPLTLTEHASSQNEQAGLYGAAGEDDPAPGAGESFRAEGTAASAEKAASEEEPLALTEHAPSQDEQAGLYDAASGDDPAPGAGESFRAEEPAIYAENAASAE
ncbi:MAG: hypothetical protein LBW85_05245, partial [Deltaproteobacteria bacterium]|nr:hypothetical protein [Deltaproteobacteria bacterium]